MMYVGRLKDLKKDKKVKDWSSKLQGRVNETALNGSTWKVETRKNKEQKITEPEIILDRHGSTRVWTLSPSLFRSKAYKDICSFGEHLNSLLTKDSYFKLNNLRFDANNFSNSIKELLEAAKNSFTMSRYKGLGEMNADQLWDTTMDPSCRTLLRVTIDDAVEANRIFSKLMGEEVEGRREFIETNAKFVVNLDV